MESTPEANEGLSILETAARDYERAAEDLEIAARHLRWTATHVRNAEVPRGCAHVFAAIGHLSKVQKQLNELAELHATKAQT